MSDQEYVTYKHHSVEVWVRKDLKGTHRDHCLCYACAKFAPDTCVNCPIAQKLYEFCVDNGMTTPVFECPEFQERHDGITFGA